MMDSICEIYLSCQLQPDSKIEMDRDLKQSFFRHGILSTETREKIGEIADLLVADRVKHIRHRGIVAAARVVFVFAQRLHEVVLALAGKTGNILFTRVIPVMAEVTAVLIDERPGPFYAGGIDGTGRRLGRRQLGKGSRHVA